MTGDEVKGAGLGYVDVFDHRGNLTAHLISGGALNAPWGMTIAPTGFGAFAGDLLVGNFGDGTINAYDPGTGTLVGTLSGSDGNPLVIDGLWGYQGRTRRVRHLRRRSRRRAERPARNRDHGQHDDRDEVGFEEHAALPLKREGRCSYFRIAASRTLDEPDDVLATTGDDGGVSYCLYSGTWSSRSKV